MWIFTRYGFYSTVCARQGDGNHGQPVDTTRVMIRARIREHLVALKERFPDQLGTCDVKELANTDYAFRIFVGKATWTQVLAALGNEMDYDNFKSEVSQHQGAQGRDYEKALHDVWKAMYRLQN